jgi:dipeptidase
MHPEPATGATAASMVAELGRERPIIAWCAQTTPCTSVFLPVAVGAALPDALIAGTGEPDRGSTWWLLKALGDEVMREPAGRTLAVQRVWHAWERELQAEVAGDRASAGRDLPRRVEAMLRRRETLLRQLAAVPSVAERDPGGPRDA